MAIFSCEMHLWLTEMKDKWCTFIQDSGRVSRNEVLSSIDHSCKHLSWKILPGNSVNSGNSVTTLMHCFYWEAGSETICISLAKECLDKLAWSLAEGFWFFVCFLLLFWVLFVFSLFVSVTKQHFQVLFRAQLSTYAVGQKTQPRIYVKFLTS